MFLFLLILSIYFYPFYLVYNLFILNCIYSVLLNLLYFSRIKNTYPIPSII
jgi:hypothetical protein